jgi:hypothetical protein
MASTRNINTPQNYCLEVKSNQTLLDRQLYVHGSYGTTPETKLAGYGLIQQHLPRTTLSRNSVDIESALFGINSTNLVHKQTPVTIEPIYLSYDNLPGLEQSRRVIMPETFPPNRTRQRPFSIP